MNTVLLSVSLIYGLFDNFGKNESQYFSSALKPCIGPLNVLKLNVNLVQFVFCPDENRKTYVRVRHPNS